MSTGAVDYYDVSVEFAAGWVVAVVLGAGLQLFFFEENKIERRSGTHRWIGIRLLLHSHTVVWHIHECCY